MRPNSVKAAVMTGPGRIEPQEFAYPEIGDDAMVIAMEMCGICGTDKHTYRGETTQYGGTPAEQSTPFPIIPGHEIVGTVAEIGRRAAPSRCPARSPRQRRCIRARCRRRGHRSDREPVPPPRPPTAG